MSTNATSFIRNRKKDVGITYGRLNHVIWYVIECYQIILKDSPSYSKSKNRAMHFEDYVKMRFLNDYLIKNKNLFKSRCSELETINFHPEVQKEYFNQYKNEEAVDKIDIYINRLGLQSSWNEEDENIYFVIECKRIQALSDCKTYVDDTQKFADRKYKSLRLPFEGQLAFIENRNLTHKSVAKEINRRLKATANLVTNYLLRNEIVHSSFSGCYISSHKRNHNPNENFTIFHMLFDYSKIVIS